jgi:hypothetical protein
MRGKHVKIELNANARSGLEKFSKTGKHSVKLVNRAKIIPELDEAGGRTPLTQTQIAEKTGAARQTVNDTKQTFIAAESIPEFLRRKKRGTPPAAPKITGEAEAHIIALARSPVPQGYAKRTVRLLAGKCVELNYIDLIPFKSVQRVLRKQNLNRA